MAHIKTQGFASNLRLRGLRFTDLRFRGLGSRVEGLGVWGPLLRIPIIDPKDTYISGIMRGKPFLWKTRVNEDRVCVGLRRAYHGKGFNYEKETRSFTICTYHVTII